MYNDVTGIILAGGKSSRMGTNKALLKLGEKSVIEKLADKMKELFSEVIIIANTPEEYNFLSIPIFKDIYEYKGPLAGIHSGLIHSSTKQNFIISCDIPLMTRKMIEYIVNYKSAHPITVCRADGFIQQLAGRYSKDVIPSAEKILQQDISETRNNEQKKRRCSVLRLIEEVGTEIIDAEGLSFYGKNIFMNMNNRQDYEAITALMKVQL